MKILDRYLLRSFWSALCYIVLTCYCLLLILELFESFSDMLENQTPLWRAVQYVWCAMPLKLLEVLPLTVMLAVLFSVGQLAHNNEILSMTAAGVSIYRVATPLFLSALMISGLMIAANETVVYSWQEEAEKLKRIWIEDKAEEEERDSNIRERSGDRLFLIEEYEIVAQVMHRVLIFDRNPENGRLRNLIVAQSARRLRHDPEAKMDVWEFVNAVRREFNNDGDQINYDELGVESAGAQDDQATSTSLADLPTTITADVATTGVLAATAPAGAQDDQATSTSLADLPTTITADIAIAGMLTAAPEVKAVQTTRTVEIELEPGLTKALAVRKKPEEMNAKELYSYIQQRAAMGKSTADYRGDLYLRLLFPFSCVIMMLIGFPFALKAQRGRTMVAGFGLGILNAIAFYALTAFLSAFVEQELIPPWAPASIPLAAFTIFSLYLLRRSSFSQ